MGENDPPGFLTYPFVKGTAFMTIFLFPRWDMLVSWRKTPVFEKNDPFKNTPKKYG